MKKLLLATIILFFGGLCTSYAQVGPPLVAQSTLSSTVSASINPVMDIRAEGADKSFAFDNLDKLVKGITLGSAFTVDARANFAFKVTVTAPENFSYTGSNGGILPVSKLKYKIADELGGTLIDYTALNFEGANVFSSPMGAKKFTVDYRLEPGFDAAPGSYTTTLTYTISAQ